MSTFAEEVALDAIDLVDYFGDDLLVTIREYESTPDQVRASSNRSMVADSTIGPVAACKGELVSESFAGQQHGDEMFHVAGIAAGTPTPASEDWTIELSTFPGIERAIVMPIKSDSPDGAAVAACWEVIARKGSATGR